MRMSHKYKVATKTPQEAPPLLGRGALFADDMVSFSRFVYSQINCFKGLVISF